MNFSKKALTVTLCLGIFLTTTNSCKNWSKTAKGGTIGAGAGALAGAVIGKVTGDNTVKGAIIGAAVGGAAGVAIGHYMDKQAAEMRRDMKDAKIERVGQGIKITFDSGILFDVDSYTLREPAKENIAELSDILKKYDDTNILFAGHTDNTGPAKYNKKLSEDRGKAVAEYTSFLGVDAERMTIIGYGETRPVASNETAAGRQKNRRVEIAIYANDELKEAAQNGEIGQQAQ